MARHAQRRCGDAGNAESEVLPGPAAREQEPEEAPKAYRPPAASRPSTCRHGQVQEAPDVIGGDVIQVTRRGAEAEGHEAPEKGLTLLDRCLAQPLPMAHPVAVCRAEVLQRSRCRRGRKRRWINHTGAGELGDEPRDAPLAVALFTGRPHLGNSIPQFRKHGFVYIPCVDLAENGLCDERVYRTPVPFVPSDKTTTNEFALSSASKPDIR